MSQLPRPQAMRINDSQCTECELCYIIAPIIRHDPQRIPVTADTLEAMAQCPTGAIVWREEDLIKDPQPVAYRLDGSE